MSAPAHVLLGAAEGTGARIAWAVVYILCWCCVVFPFLVWYAGVRTPHAERVARRDPAAAPEAESEPEHERPAERAVG